MFAATLPGVEPCVEMCQSYLVKENGKAIIEFKRISEGEAFIKGFEHNSKFNNEDLQAGKFDSDLPETETFLLLKKEIAELKVQKEKAQKLAEKLVKGILKDKAKRVEMKISDILEQHIDEL